MGKQNDQEPGFRIESVADSFHFVAFTVENAVRTW